MATSVKTKDIDREWPKIMLASQIAVFLPQLQMAGIRLKAEYIMANFLQAISLVVDSPLGRIAAIPIIVRTHDEIFYSNRSQHTVIHRFAGPNYKITTDAGKQAIVVADE